MPRTYLIFGDIEGKLGVLRVECTRCDRKGLYLVRKHDREARAQGQHVGLVVRPERRLPEA